MEFSFEPVLQRCLIDSIYNNNEFLYSGEFLCGGVL